MELNLIEHVFTLDNTIGENQNVRITIPEDVADDLTQFRLKLIKDCLLRIYLQAGWSEYDNIEMSPDLEWNLQIGSKLETNKNDIRCGVICNIETKKRERDIKIEEYIKIKSNKVSIDLVNSIIKLELLQVKHSRDILLDFREENQEQRLKRFTFILYNYARIKTILKKYSDGVNSKKYPQLPSLSSVGHVITMTEKNLINVCLKPYLKVIKDINECLKNNIVPNINALFVFLDSICKPFSRFYREHHILTEPREHLLPVIHLRIHILNTLSQVLLHAFSILGISPPDNM